MKIAVVRNRKNKGIINRFGFPCPEVYGKRSVQKVIDGLREGGHTVSMFEGDMNLFTNLLSFMPPEPPSNRPTGMVFNMSYGIQGECRYTHLPAMLEMAGVPYTGSGPLGHTLSLDKVIAKILMRDAGIPTPKFRVMKGPGDNLGRLRFPLVVKPRHESTSYGLQLVRNKLELARAVDSVLKLFKQDALVEEYVHGQEICAGLLGNQKMEFLPLVEIDFGERDERLLDWDDKYHKSVDEPKKSCPASLKEDLAEKIRKIARNTFNSCYCRDFSRVDIRIDSFGNPFVIEINSGASLGPGGSFVLAAKKAGYTFSSLVCRILDIAHERYFGDRAPRDIQFTRSAMFNNLVQGNKDEVL